MQLVRYADGTSSGLGVWLGGQIFSLSSGLERLRERGRARGFSDTLLRAVAREPKSLLICFDAVRGLIELAIDSDDGSGMIPGGLSAVSVLPFVADPEKVFGLSYNYRTLATQEKVELSPSPVVFTKAPSSVAGPFDDIHVPPDIQSVDFEAEICVVLGKAARRVSREDAASYIAGYTVLNDLTAKILPRPKLDLQTITVPLKAIDSFAPIGPVICTRDEARDLSSSFLTCRVNGEERQNFPVTDWIHDSADAVSYLSSFVTLQPGDLISMGTSQGVGIADVPPRLLKDGDVVEVGLSGLPSTRNTIRF